jgi:threonine/homoserine/homoserine lactone efflux protein
MSGAFFSGAIAGYGVAIPVGAIAILIIDAGLRRGLRIGFAAGAGTATADGVYAALAGLAGAAIASAIEPYIVELRWLSVAVLVAIAVRGLLALRHEARAMAATGGVVEREAVRRGDVRRTYLRFLGLTIVNPATVIYFAALILGLPSIGEGSLDRAAFVVGAVVASLSWQSFIATIGALAHGRLPPHARLWTSLVGNLIVLGFATNIARGLLFG